MSPVGVLQLKGYSSTLGVPPWVLEYLATVGEGKDCVVEQWVCRRHSRLMHPRRSDQHDGLGTRGGNEELPAAVHVLPARRIGCHGADRESLQQRRRCAATHLRWMTTRRPSAQFASTLAAGGGVWLSFAARSTCRHARRASRRGAARRGELDSTHAGLRASETWIGGVRSHPLLADLRIRSAHKQVTLRFKNRHPRGLREALRPRKP